MVHCYDAEDIIFWLKYLRALMSSDAEETWETGCKQKVSDSCPPAWWYLLGSAFWGFIVKACTYINSYYSCILLQTHFYICVYIYIYIKYVILLLSVFLPGEVSYRNICSGCNSLCPLYRPVGNLWVTALLTDGISISSQTDGWPRLQSALTQCQQRTETLYHVHRVGEKWESSSPQNGWANRR